MYAPRGVDTESSGEDLTPPPSPILPRPRPQFSFKALFRADPPSGYTRAPRQPRTGSQAALKAGAASTPQGIKVEALPRDLTPDKKRVRIYAGELEDGKGADGLTDNQGVAVSYSHYPVEVHEAAEQSSPAEVTMRRDLSPLSPVPLGSPDMPRDVDHAEEVLMLLRKLMAENKGAELSDHLGRKGETPDTPEIASYRKLETEADPPDVPLRTKRSFGFGFDPERGRADRTGREKRKDKPRLLRVLTRSRDRLGRDPAADGVITRAPPVPTLPLRLKERSPTDYFANQSQGAFATPSVGMQTAPVGNSNHWAVFNQSPGLDQHRHLCHPPGMPAHIYHPVVRRSPADPQYGLNSAPVGLASGWPDGPVRSSSEDHPYLRASPSHLAQVKQAATDVGSSVGEIGNVDDEFRRTDSASEGRNAHLTGLQPQSKLRRSATPASLPTVPSRHTSSPSRDSSRNIAELEGLVKRYAAKLAEAASRLSQEGLSAEEERSREASVKTAKSKLKEAKQALRAAQNEVSAHASAQPIAVLPASQPEKAHEDSNAGAKPAEGSALPGLAPTKKTGSEPKDGHQPGRTSRELKQTTVKPSARTDEATERRPPAIEDLRKMVKKYKATYVQAGTAYKKDGQTGEQREEAKDSLRRAESRYKEAVRALKAAEANSGELQPDLVAETDISIEKKRAEPSSKPRPSEQKEVAKSESSPKDCGTMPTNEYRRLAIKLDEYKSRYAQAVRAFKAEGLTLAQMAEAKRAVIQAEKRVKAAMHALEEGSPHSQSQRDDRDRENGGALLDDRARAREETEATFGVDKRDVSRKEQRPADPPGNRHTPDDLVSTTETELGQDEKREVPSQAVRATLASKTDRTDAQASEVRPDDQAITDQQGHAPTTVHPTEHEAAASVESTAQKYDVAVEIASLKKQYNEAVRVYKSGVTSPSEKETARVQIKALRIKLERASGRDKAAAGSRGPVTPQDETHRTNETQRKKSDLGSGTTASVPLTSTDCPEGNVSLTTAVPSRKSVDVPKECSVETADERRVSIRFKKDVLQQGHIPSRRPEQAVTSWTKMLVALAHCIDLSNTLLASLRGRDDHPLMQILQHLVVGLIMQRDLLESLRKVLGQENAELIDEFTEHLARVRAFVESMMVKGQDANITAADQAQSEQVIRQGDSAVLQSMSVQTVVEYMIACTEYLTPGMISVLREATMQFKAEGFGMSSVAATALVVRRELALIHTSQDDRADSESVERSDKLLRILDMVIAFVTPNRGGVDASGASSQESRQVRPSEFESSVVGKVRVSEGIHVLDGQTAAHDS
ncbi:hypothetical protein IAU60_003097 [Kwoniella sp. DSM 27419]